jgi:hypothetical protein
MLPLSALSPSNNALFQRRIVARILFVCNEQPWRNIYPATTLLRRQTMASSSLRPSKLLTTASSRAEQTEFTSSSLVRFHPPQESSIVWRIILIQICEQLRTDYHAATCRFENPPSLFERFSRFFADRWMQTGAHTAYRRGFKATQIHTGVSVLGSKLHMYFKAAPYNTILLNF